MRLTFRSYWRQTNNSRSHTAFSRRCVNAILIFPPINLLSRRAFVNIRPIAKNRVKIGTPQ